MELGEREIIYLSLHCHHQNDSCIKMGSDESHFNVSVGSVGQSHRTVSTNHNLFEEKGELKRVSNRGPSAYQPNALPLGQTGSQGHSKAKPVIYIYMCVCRPLRPFPRPSHFPLSFSSGDKLMLPKLLIVGRIFAVALA